MIPTRSRQTAIIVFTRAPGRERKGLGLGRPAQERLEAALVRRTLETALRGTGGTPVYAVVDGVDRMGPSGALPVDGAGRLRLLAQPGGSFEERLLRTLDLVASDGFDRLVVIGTDTPDLTAGDLRRAVEAPAGSVVVGPARDGGCYLLGLDRGHVQLLAGLPWQRSSLLTALGDRLASHRIAEVMLVRRRDLDRPVDARRRLSLLNALCIRYLRVRLDGTAPVTGSPPGRDRRPRVVPARPRTSRAPPTRDRLAVPVRPPSVQARALAT